MLNAYEELLIESELCDLIVKEKPLYAYDGRIKGSRIAIRSTIETSVKKACVLAEELGHYYTTTGNVLDQSEAQSRKQELKARLWAYDKQIGLLGIVRAFRYGCRNRHEAAEYLEVTEEFLTDAIKAYRSKYGLYATVDNYIVYFEPTIGVMEIVSD